MHDVKAFIVGFKEAPLDSATEFHVMLEHPDGTRELSYQAWPTKAEAEAALEQYAKDQNAEIFRAH